MYLHPLSEIVESPLLSEVLLRKVRGLWVVGAGVGQRKKSEFRVSLSVKQRTIKDVSVFYKTLIFSLNSLKDCILDLRLKLKVGIHCETLQQC